MKRSIAVLLLMAAAAPALAAPPLYVGLRVGGELNGRVDDLGGNIDTDTPYGGYAGWRFNDNFALEFGASDLGSARRDSIADAGLDLDGALYQLGLVGTLPVADRFDLIGGIGAFRLEEDGTASTLVGPIDVDNSGSGAYVELGGRYQLNEQWSLRAGYSWYDFDAGGDGHLWGGVQLDL